MSECLIENDFQCNVHDFKRDSLKCIHKSPPLRLSQDPLIMPDPFELPPISNDFEDYGKIEIFALNSTKLVLCRICQKWRCISCK